MRACIKHIMEEMQSAVAGIPERRKVYPVLHLVSFKVRQPGVEMIA